MNIPKRLLKNSYYWLNENSEWCGLHIGSNGSLNYFSMGGDVYSLKHLRDRARRNTKGSSTGHIYHTVRDISRRGDLLLLIMTARMNGGHIEGKTNKQ